MRPENRKGDEFKMTAQKAITLGAEYDATLLRALHDALRRLGATQLAHDWALGGSQELRTLVVQIGPARVVVEAETYVGVTIRGPEELVEGIENMIT
jgi:hypothetical protein